MDKVTEAVQQTGNKISETATAATHKVQEAFTGNKPEDKASHGLGETADKTGNVISEKGKEAKHAVNNAIDSNR